MRCLSPAAMLTLLVFAGIGCRTRVADQSVGVPTPSLRSKLSGLEETLRKHFPGGDVVASTTRFVFESNVGWVHPQGTRDANGRYLPPPSAARAPAKGGIIVEVRVDAVGPRDFAAPREERTIAVGQRTVTGLCRRFHSERLGGTVTFMLSYSETLPAEILEVVEQEIDRLSNEAGQ